MDDMSPSEEFEEDPRYGIIAVICSGIQGNVHEPRFKSHRVVMDLEKQISILLEKDEHELTKKHFHFERQYGCSPKLDDVWDTLLLGGSFWRGGVELNFHTIAGYVTKTLFEQGKAGLSEDDFAHYQELGKKINNLGLGRNQV